MCEGEREGRKEREKRKGWQSETGHSILFGQQFAQNDVFFSQVIQLIIVSGPGPSRW